VDVTRIIDLSHPIRTGMPVFPGDPHVRVSPAATVAADGVNVLGLEMGSQSGTHVDAPYHVNDDAPRLDGLDPGLFIGVGVIADVTGRDPRTPIEWPDLAPIADRLAPGRILLLRTGWDAHWGTDAYWDHPYLTAAATREVIARGVDVISLGIGDPDLPTPPFIVDAMHKAIDNPAHHQYPDYDGSLAFRQAACQFYQKRFGQTFDPKAEALALIGSKEGLAHIIWAYVDAGDVTLVPDPAYPVYKTHTLLAGGTPFLMPLTAENGFLPDLDAIPADVAARAKLLFLNYPNNPTGAVATLDFYKKAVAFAKQHDILIVSDNAYSEMTYDGYDAPSIFAVEGARDVAVEFWSLSKPFNMTGWRIAFVVGNAEAIAALGIIKTNTDSGQFTAVQEAAIAALTSPEADAFIAEMNEVYRKRRDLAVAGLRAIGLDARPMKGSFYLWVPVPKGHTSASFATLLLEEAGVVVTPGGAYGEHGEGYIRIALCLKEERLQEALGRMKQYVKV